jgi:hypothetical protein
MCEFGFSEEGIKKRQRVLLIVFLTCLPCAFLVVLLATNAKIGILIIAFTFTTILSLIILVVQTSTMNRSMRVMKVRVDDDKIIKQFDKGEQILLFADIVSVKLVKNSQGIYINIILSGKNKKTVHLSGFDRMQEIVELIREKISGDVNITTKQNKIDYDNPACYILSILVTSLIIALVKQGGQQLEDIFDAMIFLVLGSFVLIYKPLSKTNLRFKRSEKFLSWGMIIIAILMLIGMLVAK